MRFLILAVISPLFLLGGCSTMFGDPHADNHSATSAVSGDTPAKNDCQMMSGDGAMMDPHSGMASGAHPEGKPMSQSGMQMDHAAMACPSAAGSSGDAHSH